LNFEFQGSGLPAQLILERQEAHPTFKDFGYFFIEKFDKLMCIYGDGALRRCLTHPTRLSHNMGMNYEEILLIPLFHGIAPPEHRSTQLGTT
jgi:hypothetical protein